MAQPRSQLPLFLGLTAAGGVGYYLYSAGGSPKAAEKQFEGMSRHPTPTFSLNYELDLLSHMTLSLVSVLTKALADMSKASAKVKGELPGRANQAQHQAEAYGHQAGAKFDEAVSSSHVPTSGTPVAWSKLHFIGRVMLQCSTFCCYT